VSDTPESETESVVGDDTVTIHRAPRYFRFMIAGAAVGVIVALILTFAFPEPAGFDFSQVFGFLALFFIVIGFAVGAVVALLIDRISRRMARTISMERVEGGDADQPPTA
jgi:ATP/ADP translocase